MSRKWFRFIILFNWVLAAAVVTLFYAEKRSLPPELRDYIERGAEAPLDASHYVTFLYMLLVLTVSVVSTVGLYRFRPWGRSLYLWGSAVCYALAPFLLTDAVITPPLTWLPSSLNTALHGFTLALLYFSPVARYFERESSV